MKTTLSAIALVVALVPNFALAGSSDLPKPFQPKIDKVIDITPDKPQINAPHIDVTPDKPVIHGPFIDIDGDAPPDQRKPIVHKVLFGDIALSCDVAGTPVEFPNDIVITNMGLKTVDAGTLLKWTIKSPNAHGVFTLVKALGPGQSLKINGILGSGVEADTPCSVKVA